MTGVRLGKLAFDGAKCHLALANLSAFLDEPMEGLEFHVFLGLFLPAKVLPPAPISVPIQYLEQSGLKIYLSLENAFFKKEFSSFTSTAV